MAFTNTSPAIVCGGARQHGMICKGSSAATNSQNYRNEQAAGPTRKCARCGGVFTPQRSTARYCDSRCRLIAHRSASAEPPATANRKAADARISVSSHPGTYHPPSSASETLTPQQPRASKAPSKLDPRIVPDAKWPGMYRVRLPGGSLTDMVNLTRARDALGGREP
jgi:hypothetical protein